tara:strand:+ start:1808 stop:2095 length:288 start_codon:yes stop_codon:yes gene_type:complete
MKLIRENVYELMQRKVKESLGTDNRITKIILTRDEWKRLQAVAPAARNKQNFRMVFPVPEEMTLVEALSNPFGRSAMHEVTVVREDVEQLAARSF